MPDIALLDFMSKIISWHAENVRNDTCSVLSAIHDSIEIDYFAIAAITERYGGVYLRCDEENLSDETGPRGPINDPAARHIAELCASRNLRVQISENDGTVSVRTEDDAEPTGSLPVVLRVLATLVSSELAAPLAILSYPLTGLDERRAGLIWEATLTPGLFPPSKLRTFIPIAGGDVDVARHCSRQEGAVRIVVREGEVIERSSSILLGDSLQMILRDVNQPLVLFLGAGASASCGVPQGNYVRDRALSVVTNKPVGSSELIAEFRRWLSDHDRWMEDEEELPHEVFERTLTLERALREEFFMLSGTPKDRSLTVQRMTEDCKRALDRQPEGRQALWQLAELLPRLVIVTVNFDQLIEEGMSADHVVVVGKDQYVSERDRILARLRGDNVPLPILKLHGSIDDVSSLVVDITTTSRGLPAEIITTLNSMITEAGGCLPWVWIGCSMRDADVAAWLAGKSGITELQEWWVDPLPPRSVYAYVRRRRLGEWATIDQGLRDRQITETSDRFLSQLAVRAGQMRGVAHGAAV